MIGGGSVMMEISSAPSAAVGAPRPRRHRLGRNAALAVGAAAARFELVLSVAEAYRQST